MCKLPFFGIGLGFLSDSVSSYSGVLRTGGFEMEFQILDVDYVLVDEKPIIRIFGRGVDGKIVCGFYENFSPYFYVEGDSGLDILKKEGQVVGIEKSGKKIIGGGKAYKITTRNPAKTPEIREMLKSNGVKAYEADILFKYRFMVDSGIGGLSWIKVDGGEVATNTVRADRRIKVSKFEKIDKFGNAPFRILALDIECVASNSDNKMPEAKKDPIILVSLAFNEEYKGRKEMVLGTRPGIGVQSFDDEKTMLEGLVKIINEYDPDVLTGYNCNNFDFPYILERMSQVGVRPIFGRCETKQVYAKKFGISTRITIVGRVVVDSFQLIKKDFSLMRYGLDFVATELLKQEKVDVKKSEIGKLWRGDQAGYERLVEYAKTDSVLALDLLVKLNLMNKYIGLAKVSGVLIQDALDGGETGRIENFLLREFNKEGYIFPNKPSGQDIGDRDKRSKEELKGGFVIDPKPGLHSNVSVFDFKSMYPSIIRTFNICLTTLVKDKKIEKDKVFVSPVDAHFLRPEIRRGIIPRILEELMEGRAAVKKKMKAAKSKLEKDVYHAEQWGLKILANSFYGYLGYSRARVYDLDLANSVTSYGREFIQKTAKTMEELGYEIIYGDTDSVMVRNGEDNLDKIKEDGFRISKEMSESLPGVMELEFEKLFRRFLPLSKKRYVAWKFEPTKDGWDESLEMKGVETVRRDWCPLVGETMKHIIEILLKENDQKKAVKYFKGVIKEIIDGKIDIQKLVVTKTITRSPENYAGVQPHVELVKKMGKRGGEVPGIGDRVGYVIVKGTDLLSKRTEDPTFIKENGLEVDSRYYIDNQLLPPLERIFGALGVSKTELLGGGKQIGIFDAIKNSNGHPQEKKVIPEAPLEEMTGFMCKKCEKFYQVPPLSGLCECGGGFLFATPNGPTEKMLVN